MYLQRSEGPTMWRGGHLHLLLSFGKEGFDTTKEFREAFAALIHYFLKKGNLWTADVFRDNFCKAKHYVVFTKMDVHGVAVPIADKVAMVWGGGSP